MNKLPNIIIEGIGGSGKTTISNFIQDYYTKNNQKFIVHHFQYPKGEHNIEKFGYQHGQFDLMFELINKFNQQDISVILDRSWLGEYVWSPIYRNITPIYLESLENDYNNLNNIILNIYANPSIILERLLERKPHIAEDDPYFKQYDEPIDAIIDIIDKFKYIISSRKDFNVRSFNFDASEKFSNITENKIVELINKGVANVV
jgi:thymidylate kinase